MNSPAQICKTLPPINIDMRNIRVILILLTLLGCSSGLSFEKDYYEKVTKIKFPAKYKVVATADNGEFVTITIIDLDKKDCRKFIAENKFERWDMNNAFPYEGLSLLGSNYRIFPDTKSYFANYKSKVPGLTGWTYVIDTLTCRLYAEIEYPDMGGK